MNLKLARTIGLALLMQADGGEAGVAGDAATTNEAAPEAVVPSGPPKIKFHFKSKKDKDANGNVIMIDELNDKNEKTGKRVPKIIPAPEPVELEIPLLSLEDIVSLIQAEGPEFDKARVLIVEACNAVILDQARAAVNDDPEAVREKGIDPDVIDFVKIAALPPATRRGTAIADEVWEAFVLDYVEVMQHHGKTKEKAEMGAKLLSKRFQQVKGNKKVIQALKENLSTWFANSKKAEDFQAIYETLAGKADQLLAADEEAILAAV